MAKAATLAIMVPMIEKTQEVLAKEWIRFALRLTPADEGKLGSLPYLCV